jgi:molybdate transport system regulatory protein
MPAKLRVRFRVDFDSQCSIGIGKIELLEGIASSGSLSQAARRMRMSYRRAWLLLADMNLSFDEPVARASAGGRGGGGAVLTGFGTSLVAGYRKMESGLQPLVDTYLHDVGKHVKPMRSPDRAKKTVPVASIRRKPPIHSRPRDKT